MNLESAVRKVVRSVAESHGLDVDTVMGGSRLKHVSRARREAICVVKDTFDLSYPATGMLLGFDHTTVFAACRKRQAELRAEFGGMP